jgi:hypothetical protein
MVPPQPVAAVDLEVLRLADDKVESYRRFYHGRLRLPVVAVRLSKEVRVHVAWG